MSMCTCVGWIICLPDVKRSFESVYVLRLTRRLLWSWSLRTISTSRSCFLWASSTWQTSRYFTYWSISPSTKSYIADLKKGTDIKLRQPVHFTALGIWPWLVMATVLPGWRVCCDAGYERMTGHGVCPPAASAGPTSDPGLGGRCEGGATPPGAQGGAHSPSPSLERETEGAQTRMLLI